MKKRKKKIACLIKFWDCEYINTYTSKKEAKEEILTSLKSILANWCRKATIKHKDLHWIEFNTDKELRDKAKEKGLL